MGCSWRRCATLALLLQLLAAQAAQAQDAAAGGSSSGGTGGGGSVSSAACTATNYTQLHSLTHSDAGACGGTEAKHLQLDCSRSVTFVRGPTDEPLELSTSFLRSWEISSACRQTIMLDVSANPTMPALVIEGHAGVNSVTLRNLRFLVVGQAPSGTGCDGNATDVNCNHRSVIEIVNVENVNIINVQVISESAGLMPFTGITVKSIAGGDATNVRLDGVTVKRFLDGVRIVGGGLLDANNVKMQNNAHDGLAYLCSFIQPNGVTIRGKASQFASNGLRGAYVSCEGDMSPAVDTKVRDGALFWRNRQSGLALLGHLHGDITNAKFVGNGFGSTAPECGGGLYVHFSFMTPELRIADAKISNNTATVGGGLCVEGPHDSDALFLKVRGRVLLDKGTMFEHNRATRCGHAMATIADLEHVQINTTFGGPVPLVFPANRNTQPPTLCVMSKYSRANDFMDFQLA